MPTTTLSTTPVSGRAQPLEADGHEGAQLVARAVLATVVFGLGLGRWCRGAVAGTSEVQGTLGELGAPWIVVAFAAGAVVALHRPRSAGWALAGAVLGGLAGAGALALASFAYYDRIDSPTAIWWAVLGVAVGGLAGVAGGAWRSRPDSLAGAVAAATLGLALAVEATVRLRGEWWLAPTQTAHLVVIGLLLVGVLVPTVLTRGRAAGLGGSLLVLGLAVPVARVLVTLTAVHGFHP